MQRVTTALITKKLCFVSVEAMGTQEYIVISSKKRMGATNGP